jgi:hypothetical protein
VSVVIAKEIWYAFKNRRREGTAVKTLLIVDFQETYATILQSLLADICQVVACDSPEHIPETIARVQPDYLLMDFHAPNFEGFTVLRAALALGANPAVLAIGDSSLFFNTMCNKEKNICSTVDRPVNHAVVANRLTCMMELPAELLVPLPTREEFVRFMLQSLSIPVDWAGGKNLLTIIPLAADHPEMKVTKDLYPAAVEGTGDPSENVERNIRKAIDHGFKHDRENTWPQYFPADETGAVKKPSNAVFIKLLADILKQHKGHYREDE